MGIFSNIGWLEGCWGEVGCAPRLSSGIGAAVILAINPRIQRLKSTLGGSNRFPWDYYLEAGDLLDILRQLAARLRR